MASSKLFHTIVGVGIAVGAAACASSSSSSGSTDRAAQDDSAYLTDKNAPSTSSSSGAPSTPSTPSPPPPPCDDAGATKGPDWDAFCDATWPTTKGGVLPLAECIDPKHECKDEGEPFECAKPSTKTPGACEAFDVTLTVCAEKTWQCKPGRILADKCECWEWDGGTTCPTTPPTDAGTGTGTGTGNGNGNGKSSSR